MFSAYSELKTEILDWMERSDLSANTGTMIALAEAKLSRKLSAVVLDETLTGSIGARTLDISGLSVARALGLSLTLPNVDAEKRLLSAPSAAPRKVGNGEPTYYTVENDAIVLDTPCDAAYSFRFTYRERLALSDSSPTNWLLTNHPDIYFNAAMVWGGLYISDINQAQVFKMALDEALTEVQSELSKRRESVLKIDPALQSIGSVV